MIGHNITKEIDSLFPLSRAEDSEDEVTVNFKSRIIEDYEHALLSGVKPRQALAIVMAFIFEETQRLDA